MKTITELLKMHGGEYATIEIEFKKHSYTDMVEVEYGYYNGKDKWQYFPSLTALKQFVEAKFSTKADALEEAEAQLEQELTNNGEPDNTEKEILRADCVNVNEALYDKMQETIDIKESVSGGRNEVGNG